MIETDYFIANQPTKPATGPSLARQRMFIEEGAFLWSQRTHLANALISGLDALEKLDDKLEAAIEGMMLHPPTSRAICLELIEENEPGSFSMAVALAIMHKDADLLDRLTATAEANPQWQAEFTDALAWLPYSVVQSFIEEALSPNAPPTICRLSLQALQQHTQLPKNIEWKNLLNAPAALRDQAIRLIGEKQLTRYIPELKQLLDKNPAWATWSLRLLGVEVKLIPLLEGILASTLPAHLGLPIALCFMQEKEEDGWIDKLLSTPDTQVPAIEAIGINGRIDGIDQLFQAYSSTNDLRMHKRIAHAFSRITAFYPAAGPEKSADHSGSENPASPDDNPEEELTSMTPVDFLATPDPDRMKDWWKTNQQRFETTQRYRAGQPLTHPHRRQQLITAAQESRAIAALEMAVARPSPLFPVTAPAWRQYALLQE